MLVSLPASTGASGSASEPSCYSREVNDWVCLQYVQDRSSDIISATLEHVWITLAAIVLGLLLALPAALLARQNTRLEATILGISTGLYTIPSLALFPLLVPFTGLSALTVIIGLAGYALTILVRAILEGFRSVPDDVLESASGLGYGPGGLLLRVELPLALPVIFAGLRIATVSTVALTTVGTLVSYGGLGNLIKDGVDNNFRAELFTAAVLCVVLAVLFDLILVGTQWVLTPWTRVAS